MVVLLLLLRIMAGGGIKPGSDERNLLWAVFLRNECVHSLSPTMNRATAGAGVVYSNSSYFEGSNCNCNCRGWRGTYSDGSTARCLY